MHIGRLESVSPRGLALLVAIAIGAALAAFPSLAAPNNGNGPTVTTMGDLLGQGYFCIKTDNFQSLCMKGGSMYICPDSITCIETAKKSTTTLRPPGTGVTKKSLQ